MTPNIPAETLQWAADFWDAHLDTEEVQMVALAFMAGQAAHKAAVGEHQFGLTKRQRDVLTYLTSYQSMEPVDGSPSVEEIRTSCKFASKSSVARVLDALQERGFIHRLKNRARSITITARA